MYLIHKLLFFPVVKLFLQTVLVTQKSDFVPIPDRSKFNSHHFRIENRNCCYGEFVIFPIVAGTHPRKNNEPFLPSEERLSQTFFIDLPFADLSIPTLTGTKKWGSRKPISNLLWANWRAISGGELSGRKVEDRSFHPKFFSTKKSINRILEIFS